MITEFQSMKFWITFCRSVQFRKVMLIIFTLMTYKPTFKRRLMKWSRKKCSQNWALIYSFSKLILYYNGVVSISSSCKTLTRTFLKFSRKYSSSKNFILRLMRVKPSQCISRWIWESTSSLWTQIALSISTSTEHRLCTIWITFAMTWPICWTTTPASSMNSLESRAWTPSIFWRKSWSIFTGSKT